MTRTSGTRREQSAENAAVQAAPRRRRHRSRSQGRRRLTRRRNFKKMCNSMRQFSTMQIVIGFCAVFIQVGLIVNHSILSEGEQGIWTGAFFILSGMVCLVLGGNKVNFSSMMIILCCCLVTLFVAMTLSSLGWIGVETSLWCEYYYISCNKTYTPQTTAATRISTYPMVTTEPYYSNSGQNQVSKQETMEKPFVGTNGSYFEEIYDFLTRDRVRDILKARTVTEDQMCPVVTQPGFCGWLIEAPRILYSFLMLLGVTQATVSFMMAAIACTARSIDPRRQRMRPSIALIFDESSELPQRGIRAWELPPTEKEVEAGLAEPGQRSQSQRSSSEDEEEPPPPYEAI